MNVAIILEGYVVNVVKVEQQALEHGWSPSEPHDLFVVDDREVVGIGDWYEAPEDRFYRPL